MALPTGQRIAERRKALGLTQPELGNLIGQKQSAISHWETGGRAVEVENIIKLAAALNTTADHLMGITDDPLPLSEGEHRFLVWLRSLPGEPSREDILFYFVTQDVPRKRKPRSKR